MYMRCIVQISIWPQSTTQTAKFKHKRLEICVWTYRQMFQDITTNSFEYNEYSYREELIKAKITPSSKGFHVNVPVYVNCLGYTLNMNQFAFICNNMFHI